MQPRRYKLGVVAIHPIRYRAGLWRTLSKRPRLDANVIYVDTVGIDGSVDPTINAAMKWDVPLLDGHKSEFVPNLSPRRSTPIGHRINPKFPAANRKGTYDARTDSELETKAKGYRADLHPRWGFTGTRVIIDSTHERGERQMYVIDVSKIVGSAGS